MQDALKNVNAEPFFVAEQKRKFSFNRIVDFFKKKEETPKVRWIAFSKKIADAFTRQDEAEISKKVDGYNVEVIDFNRRSLDLNVSFNILFNMIGIPAFTGWFFLDAMAKGNDEVFVWVMGAITAVFALQNLINSFKTHEYLVELKKKMIEEGMEDLVIFVDMWYHRGNKAPNL